MTMTQYYDLLLWTQDHVDATTRTIPPALVSKWMELEQADSKLYHNIALVGYLNHQINLKNRQQALGHELKEFLAQFPAKLRLAQLQRTIPSDLPLFDLSQELPTVEEICY